MSTPEIDPGVLSARIELAKQYASDYGSCDGDHHKAWVIDQMLRALTGCPMVTRTALDCHQREYGYETQGESEEYKAFVAEAKAGGYTWSEGVPP